ncbi:conserved oligomeric Golgi complex subunit 2-like [Tropilaelaps mercedesae]|uniref:Conserved oligomeric Golgi complex subunit 2 n=1 Tax=Tropilaelaps mercedesae TaxID=418985 RepID=A0A1V9X8R2_9ACAR|nr:conserved oligomeric Golgi complex subunit 2-like [Tropilaelaps mercedesae]
MASFLEDASHELCFEREIFFNPNFSVDHFVCEKRKAVGLEQLRHDLRSHLKYLQECLVELINNDYTDFVNLSSNLVGLEKYIGSISLPLNKLRDEVSEISEMIDATLQETEEKLAQRQSDRQLRGKILLAIEVYRGVQQLPKDDEAWSTDLVERTATQIHSLSSSLERCRDIALARKSGEVMSRVRQRLEGYIEDHLLAALQNHDEGQLQHVLQVGVAVDRVAFLEKFYSERIVKPALEEIVSERVLREVLSDGLFNQVVMFVTTNTSLLNKCAPPEYNFIPNGVFPVFVAMAELRIPILFSLTSATMFHVRYNEALRFLETLEQHMSDQSVQIFRTSESYRTFMARWSTGIYFQLRYTEIATNFETALLQGNEPFGKKQTLLNVTENLYKQIGYCWSETVYIAELKPRFLRLTVQLLARYTSFLEEYAGQSHPIGELSALTLFQAAADCHEISAESVCSCCDAHLRPAEKQLFIECLSESLHRLADCRERLALAAVQLLVQLAQASVKQISDIPRLYRRTNRDIPTAPSAFVGAMFKPAFNCRDSTSGYWSVAWSALIARGIAEAFLATTRDVLDSVRKMEDSLRRLKKGKTNAADAQGVSDDDKIRLQIMIDVERFGQLLDELAERPPCYNDLFELARNQMMNGVQGGK